MVWEPSSVFLVIFLVSLGLTLISVVLGVTDLSLPHLGHGLGDAHFDLGHGHVHLDLSHGAHPPVHGAGAHGASVSGLDPGVSPFNAATVLAFLTWFGGAGFVFTAYVGLVALVAVGAAAVVGAVGAAAVFFFLARILVPGQTPYLRPEDYDLDGTVGELTVGIRPGGTGEIVYSQAGKRFVAAARSEDGRQIDRGIEVVVVRHEDGVAYVQTFERLLNEDQPGSA